MLSKSSVRIANKERFVQSIKLRKQGLSYREIKMQIPVAKSTLQNWLTLAGLTITEDHFSIQALKRVENFQVGTEASRIIRARKRELEISKTIMALNKYFKEPLFISGVMLYEAEGSKGILGQASFSNSDYRLIQLFVRFMETYFNVNKLKQMKFRIAIHESRKVDKNKIIAFWIKKLGITEDVIRIQWKKHTITRRRKNADYVGQVDIRTSGIPFLTRKLLALSDIILRSQLRY